MRVMLLDGMKLLGYRLLQVNKVNYRVLQSVERFKEHIQAVHKVEGVTLGREFFELGIHLGEIVISQLVYWG